MLLSRNVPVSVYRAVEAGDTNSRGSNGARLPGQVDKRGKLHHCVADWVSPDSWMPLESRRKVVGFQIHTLHTCPNLFHNYPDELGISKNIEGLPNSPIALDLAIQRRNHSGSMFKNELQHDCSSHLIEKVKSLRKCS